MPAPVLGEVLCLTPRFFEEHPDVLQFGDLGLRHLPVVGASQVFSRHVSILLEIRRFSLSEAHGMRLT